MPTGAERARVRVDVDELRRTNDRQRVKQDRVDDGEDRGVEADRDGQRQDGGEGEARIPAQTAERIADIANQVLQPPTARVPHRFADGVGAPQPHPRLPPRFARVQARAQVLLGLHLQVEPQLFLRLGVLVPGAEKAPQPPDEGREPAHFVPPAQFSTPFTAFTVRSHSARSAASCRRPTSVRK